MVVIILLAISITGFYSDTSVITGNDGFRADMVSNIDKDSSDNVIFRDNNGLFGIIDSTDRIIVAPEWEDLKFTKNNSLCIAKQRIDGNLLMGCIDYEGNITVPFIYQNIEYHEYNSFSFYIAEPADDNSCVIYDDRFVPYFRRSWDSYTLEDDVMIFRTENGTYKYLINDDGFHLRSAEIIGKSMDRSYLISIGSRILLSKLSVPMIEKIAEDTGKYIEFAYTGNDDILSDITTGGRSGFIRLFPDDHSILSKKLLNISEIYMYSVRSDDTVPHYAVSVTAETEIEYSDEKTGHSTLKDKYTAVIEFSGRSENDLTAVSGSFEQEKPEYPVIEDVTENRTEENQT